MDIQKQLELAQAMVSLDMTIKERVSIAREELRALDDIGLVILFMSIEEELGERKKQKNGL